MNKFKIFFLLIFCFLLVGCTESSSVFKTLDINENIQLIRVYKQDFNLESRFDEKDFIIIEEHKITDSNEINNFIRDLKQLKCEKDNIAYNMDIILTDYIFIDIGEKTFYFYKDCGSFNYERTDYRILSGSIDFLKDYI